MTPQFIKMTDEEYEQFIDESADYLCGFNCGTAVDIILNYVKRSDCSASQLQRLKDKLKEIY
jgi:hypothetical protein